MGLIAGYLGDKAVQEWNWTPLSVRRGGQAVGSLGLGAFLMITVFVADTAALAMVLISIGMALNGFTLIGASAYQVSPSQRVIAWTRPHGSRAAPNIEQCLNP